MGSVKLAYIKDGTIHSKEYSDDSYQKDWDILLKHKMPIIMLEADNKREWHLQECHHDFCKWTPVPADRWPIGSSVITRLQLKADKNYYGCRVDYQPETKMFMIVHRFMLDAGLMLIDTTLMDTAGNVLKWIKYD